VDTHTHAIILIEHHVET
jgi:hypothetical protein